MASVETTDCAYQKSDDQSKRKTSVDHWRLEGRTWIKVKEVDSPLGDIQTKFDLGDRTSLVIDDDRSLYLIDMGGTRTLIARSVNDLAAP